MTCLLTSCIKTLRQALGERGRTPRFLRTLHGQGYRFVGAVEVWEHRPADEAPHALPRRGGEGATRQAEGPSPALAPPLADLGSAPLEALTRRTPGDMRNSRIRSQARMRAEALGMRPLQAHCHCGLGTLDAKTGRQEQARAELSTAIELYRAMEMTFWLPQAEAALTQTK